MTNVTSLDRYRASLQHVHTLDPEAERELARQYCAGDQDAGRRLIEASLPFVIRIAREYRRWGVPIEDLVQQGNLGLLKATTRYDPDKGCRLITYAAYWIRAEIRDYVVRGYRIVRLGTTRTERRAMRAYRRQDVASAAALAECSGMPRARAEKLWPLLSQGDVSVDAQYEDRQSILERMGMDVSTPEEVVAREEAIQGVRDALDSALHELTERERRIVAARMLADDPCTLEKLGTEMGVSKERVRQLEARAKKKLKVSLAAFHSAA
ncbi:MAG: sigma-70 family RNA polymerase sigma factor [Myxococcales bacterium]|nr:sigma-70 family RNA polymerase sigma factor [Myxococcales bacterium]